MIRNNIVDPGTVCHHVTIMQYKTKRVQVNRPLTYQRTAETAKLANRFKKISNCHEIHVLEHKVCAKTDILICALTQQL